MPEAERTASACETWTREVMRRLEGERFNVITLKWFGRPRRVPSFLERHGVSGVFAADSAFLRGLGIALGLEPVDAPETDDPVADLRGRVALARGAARRRATPSSSATRRRPTPPGTRRIPRVKRTTIEALDAALDDLPTDRAIVCVTGDHATPASPDVIHSGDPGAAARRGPGRARRRASSASASSTAPPGSSASCADRT